MFLDAIPLGVGSICFLVTAAAAPDRATREFYEACSQVIPVLFLALALEASVLTFRRYRIQSPGLAAFLDDIAASEEDLQNVKAELEQIATELDEAAKPAPEARRRLMDLSSQIQRIERRRNQEVKEARALERTYGRLSRFSTFSRFGSVVSMAVLLIAGEVRAIATLADGSYKTSDPALVFASVITGIVILIVAALAQTDALLRSR